MFAGAMDAGRSPVFTEVTIAGDLGSIGRPQGADLDPDVLHARHRPAGSGSGAPGRSGASATNLCPGRRLMSEPTIAELQKMARATFGRELSEAQALAYRGRLPTMVQNIQRLQGWAKRLGDTAPAQVQRMLGTDGDD